MHWLPILILMSCALSAQTRVAPSRPVTTPAVTPPPHSRTEKPAATHTRKTAVSSTLVPDAEIEKDFRARLAKSKSAAEKFTIRVQGGVATIEGHTDVIQRKGTATRMAKSAGARAVVNNIKVSDAAREKANGNLAKG